jgi:hypothetical protein
MLKWAWFSFQKKRTGTRYAELVFLHSMGFVGHIVHSGVFGARNALALFFMVGWAQCGLQKKCAGTRYAELMFFASDGIYGPRNAFRCIRSSNIDALNDGQE